MKYKFLEHPADLKFQAFGKTIEESFTNAALAIKESICGKIKVKSKIEKKISVKGKDFESLLYEFLEEIIYLLDAEDFLINKIKEIKIDKKNFKIKAVLIGNKASEYNFNNSVKAVTYSEMLVKNVKKKWILQVVLDV